MAAGTSTRILQLGPTDVGLMHDMMTLFGEVFEEPDTYDRARPDREYLKKLLGSEHFIALTAVDGDRVIGGMVAYVLPKFEQARSEIYVYDLAVAEDYRRRGIATALFEALKPIARARGTHVIMVQADGGDEPAIALYSKLGRREDVVHFDVDPVRDSVP